MSPDPIEIERKGADAGLNPMFGEWQKSFDFPPVPHSERGESRRDFQNRVRSELKVGFLYCGDVAVDITLYLDLQTVRETSEYADLDNYAKSILDRMKGRDGILIDDNQIQSLHISWIDSPVTRFEISFRSSPDDFVLKPVEFFEMPDRLYYPQSKLAWTEGAAEELSPRDFYLGLTIWEVMTGAKRRMRHLLRQAGHNRLRAFQIGRYISPLQIGFHRSRIVDGGYVLHGYRDWQFAMEEWGKTNPEEAKLAKDLLGEYRSSLDRLADTVATPPGQRKRETDS